MIPNTKNKFFIGGFFFLIMIGIFEVTLRLTGFLLLSPQTLRNTVEVSDRNKLRILVLGESTSADYFAESGGLTSWPRLLEKKLGESGVEARVYNEAVGGSYTALLVSNLPGFLDKYQPQILITMMGINDTPGVEFVDSWMSRIWFTLMQMRTVKLLLWIREALKTQIHCEIKESPEHWINVRKFSDIGFEMQKSKDLDEVIKSLRPLVKDDRELAIVLSHIAFRLRGDHGEQIDYSKSRTYSERAFEIYHYDPYVAYFALNRASPSVCERVALKLLSCGSNVPDEILGGIFSCAQGNPVILENQTFMARGIWATNNSENATGRHYKIVSAMARSRNIHLIAMQYPTLPLASLKNLLGIGSGDVQFSEGISFVSNEENFKEAVNNYGYEEIFVDRFRGSWGHTTYQGHSLIADNVASHVQQLLRSGCCQWQ